MRRSKMIERAFEAEMNPYRANLAVYSAFKKGAFWADTHPIYTDDIPDSGEKTAGEILATVNMLVRESGYAASMKELRDLVADNINNGKSPLADIDHIRYYRADTQTKTEQDELGD